MNTHVSSTELRTIPASRLSLSPFNVRKTGSDVGIRELAASIEAHGLVQNLTAHVVSRKRKKDPEAFAVFAGGRRWRALQWLIQEKRLPDDYPVPCAVRPVEEAIELSLAENAHEPMHPADEFEAFKALIEAGRSVEDVAARFGVEPITVQRRLKLARVAPELISLYRDGAIALEHLYAFALIDDPERQLTVWSGLKSHERTPDHIRRAITEHELPLSSALARFVGTEVYERAGGAVRRDLFQEEANSYALDRGLMSRLAMERLEQVAHGLREEGAAFVDVVLELEYGVLNSFGRVAMVPREATESEQEERSVLAARVRQVQEAIDAAEASEGDTSLDDLYEQFDALQEQETDLANRLMVPDPAQNSVAGALVTINRDGQLQIERGLLRPDDAKRFKPKKEAKAKTQRPASGHSASLMRRLTAHRTLALQVTLAQRPDVALIAITHRLALRAFYSAGVSAGHPLEIEARHVQLAADADDLPASPAYAVLEQQRDAWLARLPGRHEELLEWLLKQPQATALELLAFVVSLSLNGVQSGERASPFDELARAAQLDMAQWWSPTALGYFLNVPKEKVLEVVRAAVSPEAAAVLQKLKRAPLAAAAEKHLAGKGWLPDCLRVTAA